MGTVGDKGQSHITIHHNTFTLMLRAGTWGQLGTRGKGQSHITIHYNTISRLSAKLHNMYVAGLPRVFTEHFVFTVSDNE